ncbi:caspase domain-containing protein [Armillaria borealis]|uniref:Caspase domain-containing protein n=1 Tax=Armillaria borealis TaxID=47425 RepID=A0AA39IWN1_9AGAR|nr:caspase domain-containing protein [Armillaria borealis]
MHEIVYPVSTLFYMVGNWISQQKTPFDVLNFLALHDVDACSENVDTMPEQLEKPMVPQTRYWSTGDDISQRTYQYVCDKIFSHITLGQHTYTVDRPPLVEDITSFNTEPLRTVERSRFWAVLVGIDAYQSCPLRGCVSDALLVEKYLKEEIGIPQERIQRLLGSQDTSSDDPSFPSRTNIVNTLLDLVDNPQIEVGDNIIIYFSGHGSGYSPNDYHLGDAEDNRSLGGVDGSIEAICPIDRDAIDSSGLRIPDISDREINSIFQQISRSKGHQITFFLDACHSGTHVRCFPEPGTRTVPPLPRASLRRMLHIADENLNMSSHVIMVACKEYEIAREVESETGYNGIFTRALIDALRSGNLSEESTYIDLLCSLPVRRGQTPVVAGKNKSDRLWFKN